MNWAIILLVSVILIVTLSWLNGRKRIPAKSETLVYLQGESMLNNPDSDSDMQEQYDFRKKTSKQLSAQGILGLEEVASVALKEQANMKKTPRNKNGLMRDGKPLERGTVNIQK